MFADTADCLDWRSAFFCMSGSVFLKREAMKVAAHSINIYAENSKRWSGKAEREAKRLTAHVKTRRVGFNIGKFGINFTAKDLDFEPDEAKKASQTFRSKTYPRTQREEFHVQKLQQQLALAQTTLSEDPATFDPGSSSYHRIRAIEAYSRQSGALSYTLPGSALGKV